MSNKCCNVDKVFMNFNKMSDGRHFTDYRAHHETDINLFKNVKNICKSGNSYDLRICLQRNSSNIVDNTTHDLNSEFNIPRCNK